MKQFTQLIDSNTLLTYALMTAPSPVQVSPQQGPPSVASLTFVISCPISVGQVTVSQITFSLPIGDPNVPDATDLADTAAGISPSVSSTGSEQWQIGPGATGGVFVLKPAGSGVVESQGLTVTFTGIQVSQLVGTAVVNIVELATANGAPQPRLCSVAVPKFPYGFFAGNFAASSPQVQNGQPVVLSWVGSVNAIYTLLWGTQSQNVSKVNQWTSPALTDTTTFILDVAAQQGGQTVNHYFSVTVVVMNPDITARNLTVLDASTLQGPVSVEATLGVAGAISGFGTVPVGCVIPYGGDALGSAAALQTQGWLFCDGSAISRTTYSTLFSVVGTRHGAGDGSTTFNLPDYRGRFLRGTDHGIGRDPDTSLRVVANTGGVGGDNTGSIQPWATARPASRGFTTDVQGNHNHTIDHVPKSNCSYWIGGSHLADWTDDSTTTSTAGAHAHSIIAGGDNETRPLNAYVDYLIRFQ